MGRKVFLSFLGTTEYKECLYIHKEQPNHPVYFVQYALAEIECATWGINDKVLIFTTQEALTNNWTKLQSNWPLKNVMPENIMISSGKTENEIWKIFQKIYDVIEDEDEIILDITHSFRSLPMLATVLVQYVKFLKSVKVLGIYYGAFETLGNPKDLEERIPNVSDRKVPIYDLTAFSVIQDWAVASNNFINFGNAKELVQLTSQYLNPILKNAEGSNEVASQLKQLSKQIDELCLIIKTNRGRSIIQGTIPKQVQNSLEQLEYNLIAPLNPILQQLKKSLDNIGIKDSEAGNMINIVQWCIDKELIQEGITLLQEGIVSCILSEYKQTITNDDKKVREFVSGYLNTKTGYESFDNKRFELSDAIVEELSVYLTNTHQIDEWAKLFVRINNYRNDINHAGMRPNPMKAREFKDKLIECYSKTKEIINSKDVN
jgi:CRISPR-associated Csx2 family protein